VTENTRYALGTDDAEMARLDARAAMSGPVTRRLLETTGSSRECGYGISVLASVRSHLASQSWGLMRPARSS
jgi:hypothetical protein